MRVLFNDDIPSILGPVQGSIEIPVSLRGIGFKNLRYDGLGVIDAETKDEFYIDEQGTKHVTNATGRQHLSCLFTDQLLYVNGEWRVKTQQDVLLEKKNRALGDLAKYSDQIASQLTGPVSQAEKDSWGVKEAAARAHLDNTATSEETAMLNTEITVTSGDITVLANNIIAKANIYRNIVAAIAGIRSNAKDEIDAASDENAVNAALDSAKTHISNLLSA